MTTLGTPQTVRKLIDEWDERGRPQQGAIPWDRERWIRALPEHAAALRRLPDRLDRDGVRAACEDAAAGSAEAASAFVCVMAWGYGDNGYGPYRTERALTETPGAAEKLARVAGTLGHVGPMAAYRRLAQEDDSRLKWLGPAFGTKYLYFCQPRPADTAALILDSLVGGWLSANTQLAIDPGPWDEKAYGSYLDHMHAWSSDLGCAPDELEMRIFCAMAGGVWACGDE